MTKHVIGLVVLLVVGVAGCRANKPTAPAKPLTDSELCAAFFTTACTKISACDPTASPDSAKECVELYVENMCPTVESIRDRVALEKVCLPWLNALKCETMEESLNNIPPACVGQFR